MPITVETAVVSRKGIGADFNTDAVNAAGKIWPQEVLHGEKGIRAVGSCSETPYYVLASSKTKGTAQSAVELFPNCVSRFNADGSNCAHATTDFMRAFAKVLGESGFDSSACSLAMLACFNDTVYVSRSAGGRLFAYADGEFFPIEPELNSFEDGRASYGIAQCSHVKEGDIFLMLTADLADALPKGLLAAIFKNAAGDIKKIAALISSQAIKYECVSAVSAVIVRVKSASAVPAGEADATEAPVAAASVAVSAEEEKDDENAGEAKPAVSNGKRAGMIVGICILAVAVLVALYFAVTTLSQKYGDPSTLPVSDVSDTETEPETKPEPTTEPTTSEEEIATADTTTEEESTSESETTTRRASSTTRSSSSTTRSYSTTAPATTTPVVTTPATEPSSEAPVSETESVEPTEPPTDEPSTAGEPATDEGTTPNEVTQPEIPEVSELGNND